MEATFIVDLKEDPREFAERLVQFFAGKKVKVTVEEMPEEAGPVNQREIFRRLEETRKQFPPKKIPANVDINKLIDEMYDQPL